jgi:hypothetical protein
LRRKSAIEPGRRGAVRVASQQRADKRKRHILWLLR